MRKLKALLIAAVFAVLGTSAFAADATVTFVNGKVEVQRNGKWIALQKGDTVAKSETISTGFQSEVKLKIMESVMYLGPVTRITLEELSSTAQKDNVNVYLKTGTARSQVKHVDNKRVNYQVHTAVAVASCRGTEWIIDDSNNVSCLEGIVAVAAYVPPVIIEGEADGDTASEEDAESKEESQTEGESSESEEAAETVEQASVSDEKDVPTTADGVLVMANQSVMVTESSSVSAAVNTVVTSAAAVTSTVNTAAAKETVGGTTTAAVTPVEKTSDNSGAVNNGNGDSGDSGSDNGGDSDIVDPNQGNNDPGSEVIDPNAGNNGGGANDNPQPSTATVIINIEIPGDN